MNAPIDNRTPEDMFLSWLDNDLAPSLTRGEHANDDARKAFKRGLQIRVCKAQGGAPTFAGDHRPFPIRQKVNVARIVDYLDKNLDKLTDSQKATLDAYHPNRLKDAP